MAHFLPSSFFFASASSCFAALDSEALNAGFSPKVPIGRANCGKHILSLDTLVGTMNEVLNHARLAADPCRRYSVNNIRAVDPHGEDATWAASDTPFDHLG